MTVNAAEATSPMKTRPSTETTRTTSAGPNGLLEGSGYETLALAGMMMPPFETAEDSALTPTKIRTWSGWASCPGATSANSSFRLDGSSTIPVTVRVPPLPGSRQAEPILSP
jgi:hypothetical protein